MGATIRQTNLLTHQKERKKKSTNEFFMINNFSPIERAMIDPIGIEGTKNRQRGRVSWCIFVSALPSRGGVVASRHVNSKSKLLIRDILDRNDLNIAGRCSPERARILLKGGRRKTWFQLLLLLMSNFVRKATHQTDHLTSISGF